MISFFRYFKLNTSILKISIYKNARLFRGYFYYLKILKLHPMKILKASSPLSTASRTYRKKMILKMRFQRYKLDPHQNHVSGIRTCKPYPALAENECTTNFVLRQDPIFALYLIAIFYNFIFYVHLLAKKLSRKVIVKIGRKTYAAVLNFSDQE